MLKKYFAVAVFVSVLAVGFISPQVGRAQTADDAYIQSLKQIVLELTKQVQDLIQRLNAATVAQSQPLGFLYFTSPSSSASWPAGTTQQIRWIASSSVSSISGIDLYLQSSTLQYLSHVSSPSPTSTYYWQGYYNWLIASSTRPDLYRIYGLVSQNNPSGTFSGVSNFFNIISTNQPPTAQIFGSSTVPAGFNGWWTFKGTDPEGMNLSYSLTWGDGTPTASGTIASGQTIGRSHTYTQAGTTSTILFRVYDPQGGQGFAFLTVTVTITAPLNQPPHFTLPFSGPTSTVSGVNKTWYAQAADPEGGPLTYVINWGDNSSNTTRVASSGVLMSFTHTYFASSASTTTYYPLLLAYDDVGNSGGNTVTVRVFPPPNQPPIAYVYGSSTVPVGTSNPWFFQAYDREDASLSYTINWGDGTSPNQGVVSSSLSFFPLSHTYTRVGTSTISIYVTDPGGLSAGSSLPVRVVSSTPTSTAPFTISSVTPTSGSVGTNVTITGSGFSTQYTNSLCFIAGSACYNAYTTTADPTRLVFTVPSTIPVGNYPTVYLCSPGCLTSAPFAFTVTSGGGGGGIKPIEILKKPDSIESLQAQLANIIAQLQALLLLLSQY